MSAIESAIWNELKDLGDLLSFNEWDEKERGYGSHNELSRREKKSAYREYVTDFKKTQYTIKHCERCSSCGTTYDDYGSGRKICGCTQ